MKKAPVIFYLLGNFLLFVQGTKAQDSIRANNADTTIINIQDSLKAFEAEFDSLFPPKKSHIKLEVGYLSNNVYFGRKDSVSTPYIVGQIAYYHKSGLYANAMASYLPTSGEARFDLFTIEAGYMHKFGRFEMQIVANKYFYNSSSYNVESEIEGNVEAAFSYDWNIIAPVVNTTISFSQQNDYSISLGVEHVFGAAHDRLQITPSFMANASTQNYYNEYNKFKKYQRLMKLLAIAGINATISANVQDATKFRLLDYEFSIPISYATKRIAFSFIPVYVIPLNPAAIIYTAKLPNQTIKKKYTEKLTDTFFFQAGVELKF
ncbi:MAG TPA: hypothetical protein VMT76_08695 [Puia sp.]|nr:hypothetical protein [Puia sp.]